MPAKFPYLKISKGHTFLKVRGTQRNPQIKIYIYIYIFVCVCVYLRSELTQIPIYQNICKRIERFGSGVRGETTLRRLSRGRFPDIGEVCLIILTQQYNGKTNMYTFSKGRSK